MRGIPDRLLLSQLQSALKWIVHEIAPGFVANEFGQQRIHMQQAHQKYAKQSRETSRTLFGMWSSVKGSVAALHSAGEWPPG